MTDERKDEAPAASAEEWPKRAPPTIDLDASDVSGDTQAAASAPPQSSEGARSVWSHLAAPFGGAIAALLVLAGFWGAGVIGQPQTVQPPVSVAQFDNVAANVGDLSARVARVETAAAKAPAPAADPALAGRAEALEKSLATVRDEMTKLNAQLRAITTSANELKAMPRDGAAASAPAPDLGPLTERLAQLEDATRALSSEVRKPNAAAADINVRRLLVANMLDGLVRRGEPFAAALASAKQVAADPNALAPLDAFAARGIPLEATYLREIVPVLQRIADAAKAKPAEADKPGGGSVLDRLQSGVMNFVRIERVDGAAAGLSPASPQKTVRRDDLAAARSDIASLPQASDPQVQAWLKSVDARAAAIAASQKFSAEALAALGKSGQ